MQPEVPNSISEADPAELFYAGAIGRIYRWMLVLALVFTLAVLIRFGGRIAAGFACGCTAAYLNFHWLKRVVNALAERIVQSGKRESARGLVFRFLLRYLLMGLTAYAILSVSPASLYGLLAGLSLPVAAIACETAYEVYVAIARGI